MAAFGASSGLTTVRESLLLENIHICQKSDIVFHNGVSVVVFFSVFFVLWSHFKISGSDILLRYSASCTPIIALCMAVD